MFFHFFLKLRAEWHKNKPKTQYNDMKPWSVICCWNTTGGSRYTLQNQRFKCGGMIVRPWLLRDNPDKNACHCRGAASTPWSLHYSKKTPAVDANRLYRIVPKNWNWHLKDLLAVPVNTHSSCGRGGKKINPDVVSHQEKQECASSASFRMSSRSSTIMGSSHYHTKGKGLSTLNANYFPLALSLLWGGSL